MTRSNGGLQQLSSTGYRYRVVLSRVIKIRHKKPLKSCGKNVRTSSSTTNRRCRRYTLLLVLKIPPHFFLASFTFDSALFFADATRRSNASGLNGIIPSGGVASGGSLSALGGASARANLASSNACSLPGNTRSFRSSLSQHPRRVSVEHTSLAARVTSPPTCYPVCPWYSFFLNSSPVIATSPALTTTTTTTSSHPLPGVYVGSSFPRNATATGDAHRPRTCVEYFSIALHALFFSIDGWIDRSNAIYFEYLLR